MWSVGSGGDDAQGARLGTEESDSSLGPLTVLVLVLMMLPGLPSVLFLGWRLGTRRREPAGPGRRPRRRRPKGLGLTPIAPRACRFFHRPAAAGRAMAASRKGWV